MAKLFHYTVTFIPEDKEIFADKMHNGTALDSGIVAAKNYSKAVNRIVEYIGKENVCEISVYECDNPLSEDELLDMIK